MMELLIKVVVIVWCSTIVRYTFAERDLTKEPCLNKKCKKVSNPFDVTENDPTPVKIKSPNFVRKSDDLFNEIVEAANVKKITEVFDNGFYSALCWVEITTITEFKNGTNNAIREYAISFETPSNIPNKYLAKEGKNSTETVPYKIFDQDTKRSEIVNFTTTRKNENFTVRQNRKFLCGSGPIYTKEYVEWLNSDKKKIELRVSPKEQNLVASECEDDHQEKPDGQNIGSETTVRQENLSALSQKQKTTPEIDINNTKTFKSRTSINGKNADGNPNNDTLQTKLIPNEETTSITVRFGSENFDSKKRPNLNGSDYGNEEIVFKMKSGLESITDYPIEPVNHSQVENYSIRNEKTITSTEVSTFESFATSRKLISKPQLDVTGKAITNYDDHSFTSTESDYDYDYEGKNAVRERTGATNKDPLEGNNQPTTDKTIFSPGKGETLHTMVIENNKRKIFKPNETLSTLAKNSDNSDIQSTSTTELDENLSTLSIEITTNSAVTKSQIIENLSTPNPSTESETLSTEQSWSTFSTQFSSTSLEEDYMTTNLPKNITESHTDYPITFTQSPKELSTTLSTVQKNETNNASVPTQSSTENPKSNLLLNDTAEKISVRVNVITDHIVEGFKDGKLFRNITPIIGVEKKIEFNSKFKNKALESYKKEVGYNWDKFMEALILRFFGNRTNESPNGIQTGKICGCKINMEDTNPNFIPSTSSKPRVELAYDKLSLPNYSSGLFVPNQQPNNPYLLYQNQQRPTEFNKHKLKYESMNTYSYPPFRKVGNDFKNSAVLFKNKQPVYRLAGLGKPEYTTHNHSLLTSSTFKPLEKKSTTVLLQKLLKSTKSPPLVNSRGKNGTSSHHPGSTPSVNTEKSAGKDIGYPVNSFSPHLSDEKEDDEPMFKIFNPSNYILQELKKLTNRNLVTTETTLNPPQVAVEEELEKTTRPGIFNDIFGMFL